MTLYIVFGKVSGTKYLGEYEANTPDEAEQMALESENRSVSLCNYCSSECEDPEIESCIVEEVTEDQP